MKSHASRALVPAFALAAALYAVPALAAEPTPLSTKITAVTVYADRAQVARSARVELPSSPGRFVIARLPGWIDAESVRVALDPPRAGEVLDVTVETAYLAESAEEAVRKAQAALRDVQDELQVIADEERVLHDEIARLESIRAFSIGKVPKDLATGDLKVKTLGETMTFVSEALRADRKQLRALAKKRREIEPILAARSRELGEVQTRAQLQQSTVTIEARGSGSATMRVSYLTPGAAWEPTGELRVSKGGTAVTILQYASVVQTTGEDWNGATLAFSTQRPGEMLDVPRAHGLMLDKGGAGLGDVLGRMGESFSRAQTVYAEQNAYVARNKDKWRSSLARQAEVQSRAVAHFARLTKRGTTAHFAALSDRNVRADGKTVRVPIASGEYAATAKLVAVPEVSLNAVRTAELVNGGTRAILPGRVALYEDGAFVGTSELGFVAPGERFSVFLGVNDRVKLERVLDKKTSALYRRGKRTEMAISFVVTVENLGGEPVSIDIADRVPITQHDDIEVSDLVLPTKVKPDAQGVVRWSESIPARTKRSWRIGYTLEYPTDFVARAQESEKEGMDDARRHPSSPSAAPYPKARKMYKDIDALEKAL